MNTSHLLVGLSTPEYWDNDQPIVIISPTDRAELHRIATVAIRMGRRWKMMTNTSLDQMRFSHWLPVVTACDLQAAVAGLSLSDEDGGEVETTAGSDSESLQQWLGSLAEEVLCLELPQTVLDTLNNVPARDGMRVDGVSVIVDLSLPVNGEWSINLGVDFKYWDSGRLYTGYCIKLDDLLNAVPDVAENA